MIFLQSGDAFQLDGFIRKHFISGSEVSLFNLAVAQSQVS